MDSKTTIIGLVIILACIIPLVLASEKTKRKKKLFLTRLSDYATKFGCTITEHQHFINRLIGIDKELHCLFFATNFSSEEQFSRVDLHDISKCKIVTSSRSIEGSDSVKVVEKLDLVFSNKDKNKADVIFNFYSIESGNIALNGELQLIEKWMKICNSEIVILK